MWAWALISYGVFAYHVLILELVGRWLGLATFEGGFWQRWLLTARLAVAVAAVSYVRRRAAGHAPRPHPAEPRQAPPVAEHDPQRRCHTEPHAGLNEQRLDAEPAPRPRVAATATAAVDRGERRRG